MNNLITKINRWADSRGLKQADPKIQWMRITEEVGEIRMCLETRINSRNRKQQLRMQSETR